MPPLFAIWAILSRPLDEYLGRRPIPIVVSLSKDERLRLPLSLDECLARLEALAHRHPSGFRKGPASPP